jgi:hypothetical protein
MKFPDEYSSVFFRLGPDIPVYLFYTNISGRQKNTFSTIDLYNSFANTNSVVIATENSTNPKIDPPYCAQFYYISSCWGKSVKSTVGSVGRDGG